MKTVFVILHYMAVEVTLACVDRLLTNFKGSDVVIVDNASPDGSVKVLKEKYGAFASVHILELPENEGFARGNNAGYAFASRHLSPDFIVVMNNDVMIDDPLFTDKIEKIYVEEGFAVLGPDIYSPGADIHQSPTRRKMMTADEVRILRAKMAAKYRFHLYNYITWNLKVKFGLKKAVKQPANDYALPGEGCVLHGACYIFSKDFIAVRPEAFNPHTFLYCEEDILALECSKKGLRMLYRPGIKVTHLEDCSTDAQTRSAMKRSRLKYKRLTESLGILLEEMKK